MKFYQELRAYSPIHDCTVARVSMTDANHQEVFMLLPDRGIRREYRAQRDAALEAIGDAIDAGCGPGEVKVPADVWAEMVETAKRERAEV